MTGWAAGTLLATTLLVALVLVLREPVARLFGARAAYALWLAPLARMVLPPLPDGTPLPSWTIEPSLSAAPAALLESTAESGPGLTDALLILWLGGAALFLLYHVAAHHRFLAAALRHGRRLASPEAAGPELIESAAVEGPIATGLLRRRILLPMGFADRLTPEQRRLAIAHEQLHHRRGDLVALAVSLVLLALHWFNPLAHLAHRLFRRDLEAACDAELAARLGPAERESYARAIVGCAAAPLPQAICTLTTIDDLKRRVTMLTLNHGRAARLIGLGCAAMLTAGGLALAPQVRAQSPEPEAKTFEKRIEIREVHGDKDGARLEPGKLRMLEAKCDGEKFEVESAGGSDTEKQKVKFLLCARQGESLLAALEKAAAEIEKRDEMPADRKADILGKMRAKIAELRARG